VTGNFSVAKWESNSNGRNGDISKYSNGYNGLNSDKEICRCGINFPAFLVRR